MAEPIESALELRSPPITSAAKGLGLLLPDAHRELLIAFSQYGPMGLEALMGRLLVKSRTAVEEHLETLIAADVVAKARHGGEVVFQLTRAGHGLAHVGDIARAWLGANPDFLLEAPSPVAWRAYRALVEHWRSALIEWIVRASPTPDNLGNFGLSRRKLRDELKVLRGAGLIELRRGRGVERYRITDWGRRGISVLAAAAAWEQRFLPDPEPITVIDAVTAILAAVPLVRLPEEMTGFCTFTAEVERGQAMSPRAGMVWARFRHGRVVACGEGTPKREPVFWVSGPFSAWLAAVINRKPRGLLFGGNEEMGHAAIDQMHVQLYRYDDPD